MDEPLVRLLTQKHIDALMAGDVERATADFSEQLHHNLGTIVAQWPLPLSEAGIELVQTTGTGFLATVRLVGEFTVRQQMRWKDRDGTPTVVEVSHVVDHAPPPVEEGEASSE